jgi:transcriptional regulator with XRE-family HTH domain
MELQGVTQQALAKRTGLSQGYLSQLYLARSTPNVITAIQIAQCLGVSVEELWVVGHE